MHVNEDLLATQFRIQFGFTENRKAHEKGFIVWRQPRRPNVLACVASNVPASYQSQSRYCRHFLAGFRVVVIIIVF